MCLVHLGGGVSQRLRDVDVLNSEKSASSLILHIDQSRTLTFHNICPTKKRRT